MCNIVYSFFYLFLLQSIYGFLFPTHGCRQDRHEVKVKVGHVFDVAFGINPKALEKQ